MPLYPAQGSLTAGGDHTITGDWTFSGAVVFSGSITSTAPFLAPDGTAAAPSYSFTSDPDTGLYGPFSGQLRISSAGVDRAVFSSDVFQLRHDHTLEWSGGNVAAASDLILARDGAGILALRDGSNVQEFRVYEEYIDASNGEWVELGTTSGNCFLGSRSLGSGTTGNLSLVRGGTTKVSLQSANIVMYDDLVFSGDNSYDIGASGSLRPRSIYAGTSFLAPDGSAGAPAYSFSDDTDTGFHRPLSGDVRFSSNGTNVARFTSSVFGLAGASGLAFGATVAALDTYVARDGAGVLAQRNGTSEQEFRLYNSYTDASNYTRLAIKAGSAATFLRSEADGTGAQTPIYLQGDSVWLRSGGASNRWTVNSSGHFLAADDNTYDIGASGASRPRNVYVAGTIESGGTITGTTIYSGAGNSVVCRSAASAGVGLRGTADGDLRVADWAGTDFGLLQFGGTTSGYPALKRSSADLHVRLADDSGYAAIAASGLTSTGNVTASSGGEHNFSTKSRISSPTDGDIMLRDSASSSFGLLQFGGTTSSYPALKRNSQVLEVRLADDSAYANIQAGTITAGSAAGIRWSARSYLISPSDGDIQLTNNAQTDFGLLQFGGTTSSFPALKRSGAGLVVRTASDSGRGDFEAGYISASSYVQGTDFRVSGTKVVGARATGWALPTGTTDRTTFATSTVTLEELAQRVYALISDLNGHGLIGS